jgi:hypothetical protein
MACKPTSAGETIDGTLTITSNAKNAPTKTIQVSCGPAVLPDGFLNVFLFGPGGQRCSPGFSFPTVG